MIGTIASVGDRREALILATLFWGASASAALAVGLAAAQAGELASPLRSALIAVIPLGTVAAILIDRHGLRLRLPFLHRQVSSRHWEYSHTGAALRWGVELGVGLATFVSSAGLFVLLLSCALVAPPVGAMPMLAFGFVRGAQPFVAVALGATAAERVSAKPFVPVALASLGLLALQRLVSLA